MQRFEAAIAAAAITTGVAIGEFIARLVWAMLGI
jgi:hypothetical protein